MSSDNGGNADQDHQTPETWQPPAWLLGNDSATGAKRHKSHGGRLFKIQVPPVPTAVRDLIQQSMPQEESEKDEQKVRLMRLKLIDQTQKHKAAQDRLEAVRKKKEQAVIDSQKEREAQVQQKLQQLEDSMRSTFEQEQEEKDQAWRQQVQKECDQELKRAIDQLEEEHKKEDEQAKKARMEQDESTKEEDKQAMAAQNKLKEEIEALQKEKESLVHNRAELIWLVKKTIKAEEKQKAELQASTGVTSQSR
jgi:hypothetical protein